MKILLVLAALLALATAEFSCDGCDHGVTRQDRTGCRLFCFFANNSEKITRVEILATFAQYNNTAAGITQDHWIELSREHIKMCADESQAAFLFLTETGGNDPLVIEKEDILVLSNMFELATGKDYIDKKTFKFFYSMAYLVIANPNCPIG